MNDQLTYRVDRVEKDVRENAKKDEQRHERHERKINALTLQIAESKWKLTLLLWLASFLAHLLAEKYLK